MELTLLRIENPYHPVVLAVLLVMLAGASAVLWMLVRRWTRQRRWLDLDEWACANGFKLLPPEQSRVPEALSVLADPSVRVLLALHDPDTALLQIETRRVPNQPGDQANRWNVLIRRIEKAWPLAGFRPVRRPATLLDFLPLGSMYVVSPGERFVAYASERSAGAALARSILRALLPPDLGLILTGHYLILDFSSRPFDRLELQRVDALAEQLVSRLPQEK